MTEFTKLKRINRLLELRVAIFAVLHDESIKPSVKMSLELDDATWKIHYTHLAQLGSASCTHEEADTRISSEYYQNMKFYCEKV